jgi:methionyl-tRNA formyltransferase
MQEKLPIGENETAGELHDRMKQIGATLLLKTVQGLADGSLREVSQDLTITNMRKKHMEYQPADHTKVAHTPVPSHSGENSSSGQILPLKHAPKLDAAICKIDFTKRVSEVNNLIRGLSPIPGAFTELNGKVLKIFRSEKEEFNSGEPGNIKPGEIRTDGKTFLKFGCADGFLIVKELQLEGKKKMLIEEFLRGNKGKFTVVEQ